jgi:plasmid stabilization system protein ParE
VPRRYRVEITRAAERDVIRIYEYIERRSPERAVKWFVEIERQAQVLSRYPLRCPVIPEADDIGVEYRHLIWGLYRTVFRIEGSTVSVVRVIHGAQLLETGTIEGRLPSE